MGPDEAWRLCYSRTFANSEPHESLGTVVNLGLLVFSYKCMGRVESASYRGVHHLNVISRQEWCAVTHNLWIRLTYNRNRKGLRELPWITPLAVVQEWEDQPPILTTWSRSERWHENYDRIAFVILKVLVIVSSWEQDTRSNVLPCLKWRWLLIGGHQHST